MAEMTNNCKILEGKLKLKTQLGRYRLIQGTITKRILKNLYIKLWTAYIWLRIGSSGGLL